MPGYVLSVKHTEVNLIPEFVAEGVNRHETTNTKYLIKNCSKLG